MSNNQAGGTPNVTPSGGGGGVNTQDNQETSTNTDTSGNEKNNTQSTGNRRNDRRSQFTGNERTWQGEKPEIDGVLGLRTEWLDKKMSYSTFMEKMVEYVLREFTNANDVLSLVRDEVNPTDDFETNNLPKDLSDTDKKSEVKVAIQQQRIKLYVTREMELDNNVRKIYGLVKGQCSHSLKTILKQEKEYEIKDRSQDVLWLMKTLKALTSGLDNKSNKRCNLFDALLVFITIRQGENESDSGYMKRFKINMDTLLSAGGRHILCSPELADTADPDKITDLERDIEEAKFKAIVFLNRSDPVRYGDLNTELKNSKNLGRDEYPASAADAMDIMVRRSGAFNTSLIGSGRSNRYDRRRGGRAGGRGYNFTQEGGRSDRAPAGTVLLAGTDGRTCNVKCFGCQTWGHYANQCPMASDDNDTNIRRRGTGLAQLGYSLNQSGTVIPREWLLLDSCSTDTVFNNCSFLGDIIACDDADSLHLNSNGGGSMDYVLQSKMKLFPLDVYYNEHSLGNIISLFDLIKVKDILITLDSREGNGFNVVYDNKLYYFAPFDTGLYYFDTSKAPQTVSDNSKSSFFSLLQNAFGGSCSYEYLYTCP